jgi:hypothetical protein
LGKHQVKGLDEMSVDEMPVAVDVDFAVDVAVDVDAAPSSSAADWRGLRWRLARPSDFATTTSTGSKTFRKPF